ncbi:MAG: hypothetical protein ABH824_00375 [Nanoarchaeota archaeon]|nr:hypothetical protein [Nanoarchaeota archaeon]MBU1632865.1 hypothetical protein [Nanoarchaeota archaeon]MBU1876671.1 hypothetical protein [Nanoarchaeota archaeon]
MKTTLKNIFTNWRVIILLIFLVFSVVAIQPHVFGNEGATIRSVAYNSSASIVGMQNPSAKSTPLAKEKILSINGNKVLHSSDYYSLTSSLKDNRTTIIETNKQIYNLVNSADEKGKVNLGLKVYDTPSSNLRKGLDLEGGIRVLLKPAERISQDNLDVTIDNLRERLNIYGLSDIVVREASDLAGEDYILIEIAGVTEEEIKDLLARQGKFEAKVGNETVFFGGKKDITYVCRSADCSGIDPRRGCSKSGEGYACSFFFSITLSPEAAERQASVTDKLTVISENGNDYLSDDLALFLDDKEVDRLKIGAELKGSSTTNIQISGSGLGLTQADAVTNTLQNMKKLQTVLITGSLPVKLEVVKMDTISPSLGKEFLSNVALVGLLVMIAVVVVVSIRYRKIKIVVPMVLTLLSEIVLILGFAALVGWNLDLAAIAGIILVVGTGVDHLVVITDETIKGDVVSDWKKKIKNAMFIVMGAYFTTFAGMLPLMWAGAGLLKGFALTTIAGLSFGVLIARPAYAAIVEILLRD